MKKLGLLFVSLALGAGLLAPRHAAAVTLAVPYHSQFSNNWCWAASSQMIMDYYGVVKTQHEIAQYGNGGVDHWNTMFGSLAAAPPQPAMNGIDLILKHFAAIKSTRHNQALTSDQLQKEMDAQRPCIARLGWTAGGGHFVVLHGFDGTTIDINDPWPANGQLLRIYDNFKMGGAGVYVASSGGHTWTHTLTTGASLDLAFVIDTTGSMGGDIRNVVDNANFIVTNIVARFADTRMAVVDYKDFPMDPYGDSGDYVARTRASFTTNKTVVINALNSLPGLVGGGNDIPESVYSALYYTLEGSGIGGWRTNPTQRIIILMGDAPGHDPEPWAGGYSLGDVLALATANQFEIAINTLATSDNDLTVIAFQGIAGGSGGAAFLAESSSAVASNITQIINEAAASERNPRGGVAALRPRFKFNLSGDGMAPTPDYYIIEISRLNPANNKWSKFARAKLPDGATGYTPTKILPKGMYRWRLGFKQPGGTIIDPAGDLLAKVKPKLLLEDSYAEFERLDVEPGEATLVSPFSFFTASETSMQYTFNAAINATSYAVFINRDGRLWRKLTVKPPANNPGASTFSVTVKGHQVGEQYDWYVVPLNYDHPKP